MSASPRGPVRGRRVFVRLVAAVVLGALGLLLWAPAASAHPLGNFTVNRYSALLVSTDDAVVDHVVDLAEVPTAQLGDKIDDLPALSQDQCTQATDDLRLSVDDAPVPLSVASADASLRPGQGGLPVLRIECRLRAALPVLREGSEVVLTDESFGGQIGWREVVARGDGVALVESDVPTDTSSDRLASYPKDLLSSPLDVRSAHLVVRPGGPPGSLPGAEAAEPQASTLPGGALADLTDRVSGLLDQSGLWVGLLALVGSVGLGAVHAVAPGHGKTVMAFYLTQRRERSVRAALSVGTTVTAAHTVSVLALGVIVSMATTVVPADLYPWFTLTSGLLLLALGIALLRSAVQTGGHGHGHGHGGGHSHEDGDGHGSGHEYVAVHAHASAPHGHAPQGHASDGHAAHSHAPQSHAPHGHDTEPLAGGVLVLAEPAERQPARGLASGRLGLVALGLAGGLVPSPSALLLFLAALLAGRPWFGVVMVVSFGAGMALTLATAGLAATGLVAWVERAVSRRGRFGDSVRIVFAYGAAIGVCAVGAGLVLRTLLGL